MFFDVLKKIVAVEGAERAGAGLCVQAPFLQDVLVIVRPCQTHLDQGEAVHKEPIRILLAPLLFFCTEAHVHLVSLNVLRPEPLTLLVAQQLPADELRDGFNLVVDGAIPGHFGLVAVFLQCPPRDADCTALAEIAHEISV